MSSPCTTSSKVRVGRYCRSRMPPKRGGDQRVVVPGDQRQHPVDQGAYGAGRVVAERRAGRPAAVDDRGWVDGGHAGQVGGRAGQVLGRRPAAPGRSRR